MIEKHINRAKKEDHPADFMNKNGILSATKKSEITGEQAGIKAKTGQQQRKKTDGDDPVQNPLAGIKTFNILTHGRPLSLARHHRSSSVQ